MEVIKVKQLFFSYGDQIIIQDASFSILEGEFIGIIGPNGGGKTTLLYLLMSFLKPTSGEIKILGFSPKDATKNLGWVPQNFYYDKSFPVSVLDVVRMGRLAHTKWYKGYSKEDTLAAEKSLEQVGLENLKKASFSDLSGGQAQRVLIAKALAGNPKILFLDEATANVDAHAQRDILNILKSLKGKITVLMVTHDLHTVVNSVDRVLCVQRNVNSLPVSEVCNHFLLGLYHPPIRGQ